MHVILACLIFLSVILISVPAPALAGQGEATPETTQVLEEEVKLSGRPQLYFLLDLVEKTLLIKGRGIELRRLQVLDWHASDREALASVFILQSRPVISRPKTLPGRDPTLDPIELRHMPVSYDLPFDRGLVVLIVPSPSERPWLWCRTLLRDWWIRNKAYLTITPASPSTPKPVVLRLTVSQETAQSLAWSVLDGMPLLIRRPDR